MALNRSPPPISPRPPKRQQNSWDSCGTPPINLYEPTDDQNNVSSHTGTSVQSSASGRSQYYEQKSPKSPRGFDKKPSNYYNDSKNSANSSPISRAKCAAYGEQRSPKIDFNDGVCCYIDDQQSTPRSPKITYTNGDGSSAYNCSDYDLANLNDAQDATQNFFENASNASNSIRCKSPKSPRKFVFDAVSPRAEPKGKNFEYYEPVTPDENTFKFCDVPKSPKSKNCGGFNNAKAILSNRKSNYNKSSQDIDLKDCSYNSGMTQSATPTPSNQSPHNKRHSIVTESTFSGESEMSCTTAICESTSGFSSGGSAVRRGSGVEIGNVEMKTGGTTGEQRFKGRRRHAINITSNPGYQVLHTSHSTLDRTCSDGVVVSLRQCRKSTSDLTDVAATAAAEQNAPVVSAHKRRGSSKGGLAYLASRRNSRDSMKSAQSNASIFSNEDIGPLAFQASARGRQRRTSNFLELPIPDHIRPRVCSLPERPYNPRQSDDLYRLRTFSISKGTVVNCGDSIISRRSRSNTSVNSTNSRASERSPFDGSCCGGGYATVDSLPPSPTDSDEPPPPPRYRVVMMGDAGVGKTALVSQFMTSEYMHTYDASLDDEFGEKTVSILLDAEESEMIFIDHPSTEMSVENSLSTYEPHGCVVVYSVVQRSSFRQAEEIINYLWRENVTRDKAVILVGNKADLARSRVIPTAEGKSLAQSRDAKFIETSSGIQHNVDELLVGILKQIRLKETRDKKAAAHTSLKMRNSKTHMSLHLAKEILQKICLSDISKSKSCENLHVL